MNSFMWPLGSSSLTRDGTGHPALGVQGLSHWATREVPPILFSVFDVDRSNHVC